MAARKDLATKRLREENKLLLLENTNSSLKAVKAIIADEKSGQRVGAIQSILRAGLQPAKQSYPAINLELDKTLSPLDQAQKVIEQTLIGKLSADHGQLIVQTLLSVEQLKHDINFVQKFAEYQQYIGIDKCELIEQIAELKQQVATHEKH